MLSETGGVVTRLGVHGVCRIPHSGAMRAFDTSSGVGCGNWRYCFNVRCWASCLLRVCARLPLLFVLFPHPFVWNLVSGLLEQLQNGHGSSPTVQPDTRTRFRGRRDVGVRGSLGLDPSTETGEDYLKAGVGTHHVGVFVASGFLVE